MLPGSGDIIIGICSLSYRQHISSDVYGSRNVTVINGNIDRVALDKPGIGIIGGSDGFPAHANCIAGIRYGINVIDEIARKRDRHVPFVYRQRRRGFRIAVVGKNALQCRREQ